jgi:hypothetical protein
MPFGKFSPAESRMITNSRGEKLPLNTPAGYAGLFWGKVFHGNGRRIKNAEDYFCNLAKKNGEDYEYLYWDIIGEAIDLYCEKYIAPLINDHDQYHFQSGFGGDECDGLIDFWLPEPIAKMPPLRININGKNYILRWEYSSGDE